MPSNAQRRAAALSALLLLALATVPGSGAYLSFSPIVSDPCDSANLVDFKGKPRLDTLDAFQPDAPSVSFNSGLADGICDGEKPIDGGGPQRPIPRDECLEILESQNAQAVDAHMGLAQQSDPGANLAEERESLSQGLTLAAQAAVASGICETPDISGLVPPLDGDDSLPKHCVSQAVPGDVMGIVLYCTMWCGLIPHFVPYGVGMSAMDTATPEADSVIVYAGVGCAYAYRGPASYVPITGVSCVGFARCNAEWEHGLAYGGGSCAFYAFSASPEITDAWCRWKADDL